MRYALNLIAPSSLSAARRKQTAVAVEDVRNAFRLFADTSRSLQFIEEQQDLMMFGTKTVAGTTASVAANAEAMQTDWQAMPMMWSVGVNRHPCCTECHMCDLFSLVMPLVKKEGWMTMHKVWKDDRFEGK
jgi:hypothetical protein